MKNPLTNPPLRQIAYMVTLCPKQQKARLRGLQARHASLVKQLAFVESRIARAVAALKLNP